MAATLDTRARETSLEYSAIRSNNNETRYGYAGACLFGNTTEIYRISYVIMFGLCGRRRGRNEVAIPWPNFCTIVYTVNRGLVLSIRGVEKSNRKITDRLYSSSIPSSRCSRVRLSSRYFLKSHAYDDILKYSTINSDLRTRRGVKDLYIFIIKNYLLYNIYIRLFSNSTAARLSGISDVLVDPGSRAVKRANKIEKSAYGTVQRITTVIDRDNFVNFFTALLAIFRLRVPPLITPI